MRALRHRDDLQPLAMLEQIVEVQMALALGRAQVSLGQQPAQPPIGGAIPGIGEHVGRAVDEASRAPVTTRKRADRRAVLARVDMRAHDAGERVAIGDADPGEAQLGRARDEFLGVRSAAQKRKIRRRRELGEARREADHANTPCMNHFACVVSRPQRPSR